MCNRSRPHARSRIPKHGARHFPARGGTLTASGPPLQTGEQRNSAHSDQHQPHPMETGHTDGPTGGGIEKAGFDPFEAFGLAADDRGIRPEAARLSSFSNTQLSHNARMGCPASCNRFTKASARLHKKKSISKLLHFGERNRLLNRLVPAGA